MGVELRRLRAFVSVAASRSFTRAAERLFITQPALDPDGQAARVAARRGPH